MAKKNIPFKQTVGAEGGIDLEQNNVSKGKITWNKTGQKEHALFGKPDEKTLIYENNGQENKIIHTGNIEEYVKSDAHVEKDFTFPSKVWDWTHNIGKKLSIEIQDTAGNKVRGQIMINDGNRIRIEFNVPVSGTLIGN